LAFEGKSHGICTNIVLPATRSVSLDDAKARIPNFARWSLGEDGQSYSDLTASERWAPEIAAQLVAYLCSDQCIINGECFSSVAGRYARVFVGVAQGWLAQDLKAVSAETIRDHLAEIRDLNDYTVPFWTGDEMSDVAGRIAAMTTP
jgi:hypothetical protein